MLQSLGELLDKREPLSEDNIITLKDIHDLLKQKEEVISGLDTKILKGITDDDDIEMEILQTEEINSSISMARAKILHRLSSIALTKTTTKRPEAHTSPPEHVTRLLTLDLRTSVFWQSPSLSVLLGLF